MECLFLWDIQSPHWAARPGWRGMVSWVTVRLFLPVHPLSAVWPVHGEHGQGSSFSIPTPHSIPEMLTPNRLSLGHTDTPRAREGQDKPTHTEWGPVRDQLQACSETQGTRSYSLSPSFPVCKMGTLLLFSSKRRRSHLLKELIFSLYLISYSLFNCFPYIETLFQ